MSARLTRSEKTVEVLWLWSGAFLHANCASLMQRAWSGQPPCSALLTIYWAPPLSYAGLWPERQRAHSNNKLTTRPVCKHRQEWAVGTELLWGQEGPFLSRCPPVKLKRYNWSNCFTTSLLLLSASPNGDKWQVKNKNDHMMITTEVI